jgi:hypothetical protein
MTMTSAVPTTFNNARSRLAGLRWRVKKRMEHYGRAFRYATGRATRDDGLRLIYDAEHIAGNYSLEYLSLNRVTERAQEKWGDVPGLAAWAGDATARVGSKWESGGDTVYAAEDWALSLIEEYASDDGVTLTEIEPE